MQKNLSLLLNLLVICSLLHNAQSTDISTEIKKLTDVLNSISSSSVKLTIVEEQPKCLQMQCKIICFNGKISQIVDNVNSALNATIKCPIIEELNLYHYEFPNATIYRGFLGEYRARVKSLYIAASDVRYIEPGAFANGVFQILAFEKLQLDVLHKNFFKGISPDFQSLSIIQKEVPIRTICDNFLELVKYQIKSLKLQVGIGCVRNLTATDSLLNNLRIVDFGHNNFSTGLTASTFSRLSVVKDLTLSHSHITFLPDNIFSLLTESLEHLDLSHNHLHTISAEIFGWHETLPNLVIDLNHNFWDCTCELSQAMTKIVKQQTTAKVFCESPPIHHNWSVFNKSLCSNTSSTEFTIVPKETKTAVTPKLPKIPDICSTCTTPTIGKNVSTIINVPTSNTDHSTPLSSSSSGSVHPTALGNGNNVELECYVPESYQDLDNLIVRWPNLQFVVEKQPSLKVNVVIDSAALNSSYGLIWFSKVTKQYYKMEVNYNEYGLGCLGSVSYSTMVDNLLPAVAYTFCLVFKDRSTISPFSCKSLQVGGNVGVVYSAWLTRDMRGTGISLIIFGIVIFTFVGILMVFVLLKHRPTLLKGSKRVATTSADCGKIIVFPKDKTMEEFRLKEQMLAKRYSRSTTSCNRRSSVDSIDSNQSYMNANLYEVIPAYLRLREDSEATDETNIYQSAESVKSATGYFLPVPVSEGCAENFVRYAEIPCRAKRISSDPLPEVPKDQSPLAVALSECSDNLNSSCLNYVLTIDSPV